MSYQTKLVPAAEAQALCERYAKSMAIIVVYDPATCLIEAAFHGTSMAAAAAAAATAVVVLQALGVTEKGSGS